MANTTWDPNNLVAVTLSGGNLTATATAATSWIRSVDAQASGKFYFELTPTVWTNASTQIGITNVAGFPTSSTNAVVVLGGGIFVNGSSTGSSLGARASNDVIGVALDCGSNTIWFRVAPSGNWNGSGTANPATAVGGISVSAIAANGLSPLAYFFSSGNACVGNFGDSAFTGAVPTGFTSGFPAPARTKAIWNQSDKTASITLSSGLTANIQSNSQGVRSTSPQTSGKAYFEVVCTNWNVATACVGVANTGATLGSVAANPLGAAVVYQSSGAIWVNNVSAGVNIGTRANGDVISVAVDLTGNLIWFRVAPAGNWNGNATYTPGGTGGVSISSVAGAAICPYVGLVSSNPSWVTANFGDSAFSGVVPAGFTSGFPAGGGAVAAQARAMVLA